MKASLRVVRKWRLVIKGIKGNKYKEAKTGKRQDDLMINPVREFFKYKSDNLVIQFDGLKEMKNQC